MMGAVVTCALYSIVILFLHFQGASTQSCASCPLANLVCDANAASANAKDGLFTQTTGVDANGCMTLTLSCTDDSLSGAASFMEDLVNGYFFMTGSVLTCQANGAFTADGTGLTVYCDVDINATVTNPTCKAASTSTTSAATTPTSATTKPTSATTPGATTPTAATTAASGCCSEWSPWSTTVPCTDNCGSCGMASYTRTCTTSATCPCPGNSTKTAACNLSPCTFPRKSCCNGASAKAYNGQILCLSPNQIIEAPPQKCGTCPAEGIWGSWSDVTCSDTCGGYGTGTRRRKCISQDIGCPCTGSNTTTGLCALKPCNFPRTSCATSLKAAAYNKQILCLNSTPTVTATTFCPTGGLWEPWGEWSSCPSNCGACANATRTRICASAPYGCPCSESNMDTLPCNRQKCNSTACCVGTATTLSNGDTVCFSTSSSFPAGVWGNWTNFGCTQSCGLCGVVTQIRTCSGGVCTGASTQTTTQACGSGLCAYGQGLPSCCSPAVATVSGSVFICAVKSQ